MGNKIEVVRPNQKTQFPCNNYANVVIKDCFDINDNSEHPADIKVSERHLNCVSFKSTIFLKA